MPSNKFYFLITALILNLALTACTVGPEQSQDHIIGNTIDNISSLAPAETESVRNLIIYDKTVHKIHQFNLDKMQLLKSYPVQNPDSEHFVLADNQGRYAIDLHKKGFSIFSMSSDGILHDPIQMQGTPRSAAFRPGLGYLIVYDDLGTVGVLKLTEDGGIIKKTILGNELLDGFSISAGDLNENGQLILALSDSSIAIVDLEQTLNDEKWAFTRFNTTLRQINWVAPVPGQASQVLLRDRDGLTLMDLVTKTVLDQNANTGTTLKVSKNRDPHVIQKSGSATIMTYVDQGLLKTKTLYRQRDNILTSFLDVSKSKWFVVDFNKVGPGFAKDADDVEGREFKYYRTTDMLVVSTKDLPSKAKLQLADDFIFALFPSELGYAARYSLQGDQKSELKYFNVKHIGAQ